MKREPGYYWVKEGNLGWSIAYFGGLYWWFVGLKYDYEDSEMDEINESRILSPDEWFKHTEQLEVTKDAKN